MTGVFVDTSGWANVFIHSDAHHRMASTLLNGYRRERRKIFTTNYVLAELSAVLLSPFRVPNDFRDGILQEIKAAGWVTIVQVEDLLDQDSWEYLFSRRDKNYSLVDCSSFVLMEKLGLSLALTTDHHFEQAGFIRLLK